jgi:hypothetical protein
LLHETLDIWATGLVAWQKMAGFQVEQMVQYAGDNINICSRWRRTRKAAEHRGSSSRRGQEHAFSRREWC